MGLLHLLQKHSAKAISLIPSLTYGPRKRFLAFGLECIGFFVLKPLSWFLGYRKKEGMRILLIEPFQMGDVAALSAMFEPLRKRFPDARLFVLGKKGPVQIATLFEEVDEVLTGSFPWSVKNGEKGSWILWFKQMLALRQYGFDLGIDVRGDVRSHLSLILAGCQKILSHKRYIYSDIFNHGLLCDYEVKDCSFHHVFDRNRFLLTGLGISEKELFPIRFPLFSVKQSGQTPTPARPYVVFHIGSSWEFKMWPFSYWAELIRLYSARYDMPLLVIAGPGEEALVDKIREALHPDPMPEVRFPTLEELVLFIQHCHLLIGCDSGPMGIANCLDTPRIALFGPGLPEVWKPYSRTSVFLQNIEGYDCYPCILKECVNPHSPCISKVSVQHVFSVANSFLDPVSAKN